MSATLSTFHESDPLLARLVRRLREHPRRIVFPDGLDVRVLRVAAELARLECVAPILLGNRKEIHALAREHGISTEFTGVVEPEHSSDFLAMCERYRRVARIQRRNPGVPEEVMARPAYFAAMMVQYGFADGIVGGNASLPAAWFRSLLHVIPRVQGRDSASACMPMQLPMRPDLGSGGWIFLADCAVIPSPTVGQLADIAVESARLALLLTGEKPRVAMISFSTRGSARNAQTQKIIAATALARDRARKALLDCTIDGEVQVDTALDPVTAQLKAPDSPLQGRANVLVFAGLDAAHAAGKLLECVSGALSGGQHVMGLKRPAVQVPRTATADTIMRAALTVAYRALSARELLAHEESP